MSEYVSASTEMDTSYAAGSIASEAGVDYSASLSVGTAAVVVGIGAALAWLVAQAQEEVRQLDAAPAAGVLPSLDRRADPCALQELRYASALRNALARPQLRLLRASIEAEAMPELCGSSTILDRLAVAFSTPDLTAEAREARSRLERAVSKGAARQLAAEERLLERAANDALREIGYEVQSRRNPRTGRLALRAQHPRQGTRVVVDLDARRQHLAADFAGFSGVACSEERDRLFAALSRRGYKTRVEGHFGHSLQEGGPLSQEIDRLFAIAGAAALASRAATTHERTRVGG
jgi:hypothetical protein